MKPLRIGAHDWKVKFGDKSVAHLLEGAYGQTREAECLIVVSTAGTKSHIRETLLHEVIHAAMRACGIANDLDDTEEERIVNRLTKVLLPALRDNPELVEFLLDGISTEGTDCPPPQMRK